MQTRVLNRRLAADGSYLRSAASSDSNILRTPITEPQWEFLKKTPVETVRWSARAIRALEYAQCKNLGDVFSIPKQNWAEMRNVWRKTVRDMAQRIEALLNKNSEIRGCSNPNTLEQKIRRNQIRTALNEAFVLGELTVVQIKVLELRYGLSGHPPLLLEECAKKMRRTKQWMQFSEAAGNRHLSRHPEIMRGFQRGLQAIQGRLWRRVAGKNNALISNQLTSRELYKRAGGPEGLLIKVCYGDMRKWLDKNLPSTPKGWLIPV